MTNTNGEYTVKTDVFEGPLDMLLSLIEKRKLIINDIALAKVTDEFVEYINTHRSFPVSQASHFIYIATTLLLIKSKSLLPTLELTEEEEGDIADLEQRLALYDRFKKYAAGIRKLFGDKKMYYRKPVKPEPVFAPDEKTDTAELQSAMERVLTSLPKQRVYEQASVENVVSLESVLENLQKRVMREVQLSFKDFSGGGGASRQEVVVSFLALLELIKQGMVTAQQYQTAGDITIESQEFTTPQYY